MSMPQTPEDREALQREIQAAIAAGRDLDPEMDGHLADSALDRYTKEKAARDRAVTTKAQHEVAQPRQPNPNLELVMRGLGTALIIGGIVFAVVFSKGAALMFWWLIFPLGAMLRVGWGGRWSSRHRYAYGNGYQPDAVPDAEARQRERIAKRQRKIEELESEITRLKRDDYV